MAKQGSLSCLYELSGSELHCLEQSNFETAGNMTIRTIVKNWAIAERIKDDFLEWLPSEGYKLDGEPGPGFFTLELGDLRPPFNRSDAKDILSQLPAQSLSLL